MTLIYNISFPPAKLHFLQSPPIPQMHEGHLCHQLSSLHRARGSISDSPDMPTLVAYRIKLCPLSTVMWHIAAYRKIEYASARTVLDAFFGFT